MRILRLALALLLPLSLLAACGDDDDDVAVGDDDTATTVTTAPDESSDVTEEPADMTIYDEGDDGTTVDVTVGDTFDVALTQCIGCGYVWKAMSDVDAAVLTLASESETEGPQSDSGEPMVGGENQHVWHYEVAGAGETTIELGYIPPGRTEPEETFTLTVVAAE